MDFLLLGPFEVRAGGGPVDLGARKNRLILAVLALNAGRPVPIARLIALAWPDGPPPTAVNAVMVAVSKLRAALRAAGGATDVEVVRAGDGYLLRTDPERVDAGRFTALLARAAAAADDAARVALLDRALALWRGPALDGDAPPDVRERLCRDLDDARLAAVEDRLDARLRQGAHRELLAELIPLVEENPLRERLAGSLMLALHRSGRQAEALAVYRTARDRLAGELGLPPSRALRELETAVLRDDPAIAVPTPPAAFNPPGQLPPVVGGFAGRHAELAAMDAAADPVIVLSGTAGAGKTALAVRWAHQARDRFPDGQLYVNLRGFDPSRPPLPPQDALRGFLDALDVPRDAMPTGLAGRAELFRARLADRRLLIVLDNARDADQVGPLLAATPGCVTVITTRTQLAGRQIDVGLLSPAEAHELLARRLGADRVAAEPQAVDDLTARCARLALALAVVAARVMNWPELPLAAFADELRDARDRLDVLDSDDPETNVRAVLSWSYRSLSPGAARLFRLLATHPGPDIAIPAAASLTGLAVADTRDQLDELLRGNLLTEAIPGRFALHDLLRAYAGELTAAHDPAADRRAALGRVLDHYLHTAVAAVLRRSHRIAIEPPPPAAGVVPEQPADVGAWFHAEDAVLREALRQSPAAGFDVHAWQLAWALADEHCLRGRWQEWADAQEIGLAAARRLGDRHGEATAHRSLGRALAWQRRHDEAYPHLARALELFAELGEPADQAHTELGISWMLDQQRRHREALQHDRRAWQLYAAAGNRAGEATALTAIAWDLGQLGELERSLTYTRRALAVHEELGNLHGQDMSWNTLGFGHLRMGRHAEALAAHEKALELARRKGDRYSEAYGLQTLGDAQAAAGRRDAARQSWTAALRILDELGHPAAVDVRARLDTPAVKTA